MNLQQLYPDFLSMPESFFEAYHSKRKEDLQSSTRFEKKPARTSKIGQLQRKLSTEELEMAKKLGLKAKDMISLIGAIVEEEEEEEELEIEEEEE